MVHFKEYCMLASILVLSGCTPSMMAPVEQIHQSQVQDQKIDNAPLTVIKKQTVYEYYCKKEKVVRIQYTGEISPKSTILVTFNQRTYRLSPAVTQKAKKYTNIRWVWSEDFSGIGSLRDNRNNLLAENCIKKES